MASTPLKAFVVTLSYSWATFADPATDYLTARCFRCSEPPPRRLSGVPSGLLYHQRTDAQLGWTTSGRARWQPFTSISLLGFTLPLCRSVKPRPRQCA